MYNLHYKYLNLILNIFMLSNFNFVYCLASFTCKYDTVFIYFAFSIIIICL